MTIGSVNRTVISSQMSGGVGIHAKQEEGQYYMGEIVCHGGQICSDARLDGSALMYICGKSELWLIQCSDGAMRRDHAPCYPPPVLDRRRPEQTCQARRQGRGAMRIAPSELNIGTPTSLHAPLFSRHSADPMVLCFRSRRMPWSCTTRTC